MKPLFIPLKTEFFEAFEKGTKTVEYRKYGPRWNEKTCEVGRAVTLSHGYGTKRRLQGVVKGFTKKLAIKMGSDWLKCYGNFDGHAACIEIELIPDACDVCDGSGIELHAEVESECQNCTQP